MEEATRECRVVGGLWELPHADDLILAAETLEGVGYERHEGKLRKDKDDGDG